MYIGRKELLALHLGSPLFFGGSVLLIFSVLSFVCGFFLRPLSCLPNVASVFLIVQSWSSFQYSRSFIVYTFEHIIVLNQIKFHPLINAKHILYTYEFSLPCQAILNMLFYQSFIYHCLIFKFSNSWVHIPWSAAFRWSVTIPHIYGPIISALYFAFFKRTPQRNIAIREWWICCKKTRIL